MVTKYPNTTHLSPPTLHTQGTHPPTHNHDPTLVLRHSKMAQQPVNSFPDIQLLLVNTSMHIHANHTNIQIEIQTIHGQPKKTYQFGPLNFPRPFATSTSYTKHMYVSTSFLCALTPQSKASVQQDTTKPLGIYKNHFLPIQAGVTLL